MTETPTTSEERTAQQESGIGPEPGPLGPCEREISVEVPAEIVGKELEALVQRYQKLARIPGFRKGKVPAGIIRKRFAPDLKSEVVESLLPQYFKKEVSKRNLNPISSPRIVDFRMEEDKPLQFRARFDVLPEINVSGYTDVNVEKPDLALSDEEFNAELQALRERQATFVPVEEDRALQGGDWAQVSFVGRASEQAERPSEGPPAKADDVLVEIGGPNTVKEFSENLQGAKLGEQRTFDVGYAEDFQEKRLAGKTIVYTVIVNGVKKKQLPQLDDAFAKELGDFSSLDDFKARYRQQLAAEKAHRAEHDAKERLLDKLIDRFDFPVPESLVERQTNLRLERGLRALAAQGMREEHMRKMDFKRLRQGQRDSAIREVKASLILDRIAGAENIEITEEDIHQELKMLSQQTKQSVEALRQRLTREGALDRIRDRMRNEKTLSFLYQKL